MRMPQIVLAPLLRRCWPGWRMPGLCAVFLFAFSRKRRVCCPSCGARRLARTAAHLVDHVIPHVPVRQWVLSLPIPLRLLLATQPKRVTPVRRWCTGRVPSGPWAQVG